MTRYSLSVIICQFLQDIIKIDQKQMKRELERRSTLENRNWSDRSSRSTTTTPLPTAYRNHIRRTTGEYYRRHSQYSFKLGLCASWKKTHLPKKRTTVILTHITLCLYVYYRNKYMSAMN